MSEKELWALVLRTLLLLCKKGALDTISSEWTDKLRRAADNVLNKGVQP